MAGTTAATTGSAIHREGSSEAASCLSMSYLALVLSRLSVEDQSEGRVSERSDTRELRRRETAVGGVDGCAPSPKVAARFSILWRSWGGMAWLSDGGAPSIARAWQARAGQHANVVYQFTDVVVLMYVQRHRQNARDDGGKKPPLLGDAYRCGRANGHRRWQCIAEAVGESRMRQAGGRVP